MAELSPTERLAFAHLALCDALEEQDTAKANALLAKARKHAYAVKNRNRQSAEEALPETCVCPVDGRPECSCASVCRCDFSK